MLGIVGGSSSGAWWRRRRQVPVTTTDQSLIVSSLNSSTPGHFSQQADSSGSVGGSVTLVLPSTMPRSAGSSPGIAKPAGASPLVPSCRSAFSLTSRGVMPTSPYSDSAALDHQRRITTVKQMAQLFEEASSRRPDEHHLGVDLLARSRQFAVERRNFAVNSELFFFSTSTTTTTTATTSSSVSRNYETTIGRLHSAQQWHKTSTDLRLEGSGITAVVSPTSN